MHRMLKWHGSVHLLLSGLDRLLTPQANVADSPNVAFLFQTKFQERSIACEPTEWHFALGDYFSGLQLFQRAGQNRGAVYFVQALILDFG